MKSVPFSKLCPGGNPTILVTGPVDPSDIPGISARLMNPLHVFAEQVGVVRLSITPHLQMMGGEFCVNATRCAAFWLALQNRLLWNGTFWQGEITVSGATGSIDLAVSGDAKTLHSALGGISQGRENTAGEKQEYGSLAPDSGEMPALLYCAARMPCDVSSDGERAGATLDVVEDGAVLVSLSGISHLLLDKRAHNMPADWKNSTRAWRKKVGIHTLPASGVIWYEADQTRTRIYPAVYVRDTDCEHMETACGSASLALALVLKNAAGLGMDVSLAADAFGACGLNVTQPSGENLTIFLETSPLTNGFGKNSQHGIYLPPAAWVSGPVRLVAEGIAYL